MRFSRKKLLTILCLFFAALMALETCCAAEETEEILTVGSEEAAKESWNATFIQRLGHHFTFTAGYMASHWDYPDGKRYQHDYLLKTIGYAYHMKLFKPLSFFLGSSLGYAVDLKSSDSEITSSAGKLILPGFLVGLSLNFSSRMKANLGVNIAWSRSLGLSYKGDKYEFNTRTSPEVYLSFDYFFSPNWAITASVHYRREIFLIDNDEIRKNLKAFYGSTRTAAGLLVGFTFHNL